MIRAGLKGRIRNAFRSAKLARMHSVRRGMARRALATLEKSGRRLSPRARRDIRDYARENLGWRGYADWLAVYTVVAGKFRPGWLPENYYLAEVLPQVNGGYHHISRYRCMNNALFRDRAFPDLVYLANGVFYDTDLCPIPPGRLVSWLAEQAEEVVVKSDNSAYGTGVRLFRPDRLDARELAAMGNGVIQKRVFGHGFFDRFGLPSLATLRVATIITDEGRAEVSGCYLKLGRSGHGHVFSSDQLRIAVDWRSGEMADQGFLSSWEPVARHPDTGSEFAGICLPMIEECAATALRLHARMPQARFLSWDMLVDHRDQVQVLEWEGGVVSFAEATQGPCFARLGWDRMHLRCSGTVPPASRSGGQTPGPDSAVPSGYGGTRLITEAMKK